MILYKEEIMRKIHFYLICLFLCFPLISSCVIAVVEYSSDRYRMPGKEFHETLPFPEEGELVLENIYGNIEIHGWDKDEVEIFAKRILPRRYGHKFRISNMNEFFPGIDVDEKQNTIHIRTEQVENREEQGQVDYILNVPRFIHLKHIGQKTGDILISSVYGSADIDLDRGNIVVENFSGSLSALVREGEIELHLFDVRDEDEIRAETDLGNIVVYLEENVNILIEAEAQEGRIFTEFNSDRSRSLGRYYHKIGEGEARLFLISAEGEIHIKRAKTFRY